MIILKGLCKQLSWKPDMNLKVVFGDCCAIKIEYKGAKRVRGQN